MSRLARPATSADDTGKLSHSGIWSALDALAAKYGMSPSGLAKRAGLDATTFNKSKRQTADGRLRWPSTESIAKVLDATGASLAEFMELTSNSAAPDRAALPTIPLSSLGGSADPFDANGQLAAAEWRQTPFPNVTDERAFMVELTGQAFAPVYRDGERIVVSPSAPLRPGDRAVIKEKEGGAILLVEFKRRSEGAIEARPLGASKEDRLFAEDAVAWMHRIVWASQ